MLLSAHTLHSPNTVLRHSQSILILYLARHTGVLEMNWHKEQARSTGYVCTSMCVLSMCLCMYVCMYFNIIYLLACSITLVISNTTCYLHLVFTIIVFFLLVNLLTVLLNAFM